MGDGREGKLTVEGDGGVTVHLQQGNKDDAAVFTGSTKTCTKECVLLYHRKTGQFTLERLTTAFNLKKVRSKASSRVAPNHLPTKAQVAAKRRNVQRENNKVAAAAAASSAAEAQEDSGMDAASDGKSPSSAGSNKRPCPDPTLEELPAKRRAQVASRLRYTVI